MPAFIFDASWLAPLRMIWSMLISANHLLDFTLTLPSPRSFKVDRPSSQSPVSKILRMFEFSRIARRFNLRITALTPTTFAVEPLGTRDRSDTTTEPPLIYFGEFKRSTAILTVSSPFMLHETYPFCKASLQCIVRFFFVNQRAFYVDFTHTRVNALVIAAPDSPKYFGPHDHMLQDNCFFIKSTKATISALEGARSHRRSSRAAASFGVPRFATTRGSREELLQDIHL